MIDIYYMPQLSDLPYSSEQGCLDAAQTKCSCTGQSGTENIQQHVYAGHKFERVGATDYYVDVTEYFVPQGVVGGHYTSTCSRAKLD